jgi:predicted permease
MSKHEDDWQEELESHLALRADHGATPAEARRRFGNRLQISEAVRAVHVPVYLDHLQQDLRYALRGLRHSPLFTAAALLTLALGLGASTAVFSVVDRILFRPLPYAEPDRLVWLGMAAPIDPNEFLLSPDYLAWRKTQTVLTHLTATRGNTDCDVTSGDPVRYRCAQVDDNFLTTLGVRPLLGRDLQESDGADTALISHRLWLSRYGANPALLNQTIEINRQPVRIVGVLPPGFELPTLQPFDLLQRMTIRQTAPGRPRFFLTAFGRLRPGQTAAQARDQFQPLFAEALKSVPPDFRNEVALKVHSLRDRQTRDSRRSALLLLGAVALMLLIACANVANLLLARAHARQREWSIRQAIGASHGRLLRQSITESLLLASLGAAAGLLVARSLLAVFVHFAPDGIPRLAQATIDLRVLLIAIAITIGCSLLFGLAPLLLRRGQWFRSGLVVAQIAVTVVLLASAVNLLQSLLVQLQTPLGLRPDGLLVAEVGLHRDRYPQPEQQLQFFEALEERLAAIPGVQAVALADALPPHGRLMTTIFSTLQVEGRPANTGAPTGGMVVHRQITPHYFSILGIPIVRGRAFTEEDRRGPEDLVIISESLARRLFPQQNPIGQRMRAFDGPFRPILGVAADVRNAGLTGKDDPEYYELRRHHPSAGRGHSQILIQSTADPAKLTAAVRNELRQLDPHLPAEIYPLARKVDALTAQPRFQSALLSGFALSGLILAAIGLYGVLAFLVARRAREIAVRMALGATPAQVRGLVLRQAPLWTSLGLGLGSAAAVALNLQQSLALTAAVLALAALFAAWWPSARAARVDPATALRWE